LEVELLLLDYTTGQAQPFDGDRGIEKLLTFWKEKGGWREVLNGDRLIGLDQDSLAITLEPGGQIEFSSRPHGRLQTLFDEFDDYLRDLKSFAKKLGIRVVHLGVQPITLLPQMPWVPKFRYNLMRKYYETLPGHSLDMMSRTASIQINLDYQSEKDAGTKMG